MLDRPRIRAFVSPSDALLLRQLYAQQAIFFDRTPSPQVCRDPGDDYLLGPAAAARADYLVTRDEDLLVLGCYQSTEIVYPARFLQILSEEHGPEAPA